MKSFLDTNILVRHLTGDPPAQAKRATAFLAAAGHELILADLILAEMVYVLESYYGHPRGQVAEASRSLLALPSVAASDHELLLRAVELYEGERLDFADAYVCAAAELSGVGAVASFDRSIDRVPTVRRVQP
jgi:predicted nucleic-acid-binding protein